MEKQIFFFKLSGTPKRGTLRCSVDLFQLSGTPQRRSLHRCVGMLRRGVDPYAAPLRTKFLFLFKNPIGFSFSPLHKNLVSLPFSLSFSLSAKNLTLDLPQWLQESRSRRRDGDPTPPRKRHHPLKDPQRVHFVATPEPGLTRLVNPNRNP